METWVECVENLLSSHPGIYLITAAGRGHRVENFLREFGQSRDTSRIKLSTWQSVPGTSQACKTRDSGPLKADGDGTFLLSGVIVPVLNQNRLRWY